MTLDYDDSRLTELFEQLEPKRRLQAVKGAYRKAADKMRKGVIGRLRSEVRSSKDLERGVRRIVFKRVAGFRVTVGTKRATKRSKAQGYHKNRQGLEKPVLIWMEEGTRERRTKRYKMRSRRYRKPIERRGHRTGRMRAYKFVANTFAAEGPGVAADVQKAIVSEIDRVAKKYGCK